MQKLLLLSSKKQKVQSQSERKIRKPNKAQEKSGSYFQPAFCSNGIRQTRMTWDLSSDSKFFERVTTYAHSSTHQNQRKESTA